MGLFDRFRKRVTEVASEVDTDKLSAEEDSLEAKEALVAAESRVQSPETPHLEPEVFHAQDEDEEWEDLDEIDETPKPSAQEDEWDDFDDEEEISLPVDISRKDKKRLEKIRRADEKRLAKQRKELKKRGAVEVARPKGSNVDLSVMRTTTGRQLVSVQSAPKGSVKEAEIETEAGTKVKVELGGGVVSEGGRVIKAGGALDNLLE
ncbi:MAG: hypothetical protein P8R00_03995, partial [Candidatus Poseidoniaceae archaeon]|nr:hypothetical protein [Candidatus Poseidoniaceae archaeon]